MKACVFLADGFEEIEALSVVDLLRRAEVETITVSISDSLRLTGRSGISVEADVLWSEEAAQGADLLVLPGGQPGTTALGKHEGLKAQLKEAAERGVYLSAICAAPTVLAAHGLLAGRRAVCYPGLEDSLKEGGAIVEEGCAVVRDGNVITSRGAGTAIPFALKLIEVLAGEEKADRIAESIVYG